MHTPYPIQFGSGDWITVVTNVSGTFTGEMMKREPAETAQTTGERRDATSSIAARSKLCGVSFTTTRVRERGRCRRAELRKVLGAMGARVVEGEVAVGHVADRFDARGRLNDPNLEEQLGEVVRALIVAARARDRTAAGNSETPAVDSGLVPL